MVHSHLAETGTSVKQIACNGWIGDERIGAALKVNGLKSLCGKAKIDVVLRITIALANFFPSFKA
jgi:hypothetical protein